ncbi:hypothetical protein [Sulfurimonas sp.]|uniref:hypothetical protein n=1 Tax=Sulfurimonas sp. TaxID=2022749 RepID=UPI00260A135D|nr:hypothetical protein [Sulfurimonas sp.]
MIRIFLFSILFVQVLFGYNYNSLLLKADATIFPKIMLMDKKIKNKLIDNKIIYTIVYDQCDYETAIHVKEYIENTFQKYMDRYPYKVDLAEFSHLSLATKASAFYVLKSSTENIKKAANIARQKGIISFSYDINNLKYDLLFSLVIENSTILYLNKEYLHTNNIDFVDSLLSMVRFIGKKSI